MKTNSEVETTKEFIACNLGHRDGENFSESPVLFKVAGAESSSSSQVYGGKDETNEANRAKSKTDLTAEEDVQHQEVEITIEEAFLPGTQQNADEESRDLNRDEAGCTVQEETILDYQKAISAQTTGVQDLPPQVPKENPQDVEMAPHYAKVQDEPTGEIQNLCGFSRNVSSETECGSSHSEVTGKNSQDAEILPRAVILEHETTEEAEGLSKHTGNVYMETECSKEHGEATKGNLQDVEKLLHFMNMEGRTTEGVEISSELAENVSIEIECGTDHNEVIGASEDAKIQPYSVKPIDDSKVEEILELKVSDLGKENVSISSSVDCETASHAEQVRSSVDALTEEILLKDVGSGKVQQLEAHSHAIFEKEGQDKEDICYIEPASRKEVSQMTPTIAQENQAELENPNNFLEEVVTVKSTETEMDKTKEEPDSSSNDSVMKQEKTLQKQSQKQVLAISEGENREDEVPKDSTQPKIEAEECTRPEIFNPEEDLLPQTEPGKEKHNGFSQHVSMPPKKIDSSHHSERATSAEEQRTTECPIDDLSQGKERTSSKSEAEDSLQQNTTTIGANKQVGSAILNNTVQKAFKTGKCPESTILGELSIVEQSSLKLTSATETEGDKYEKSYVIDTEDKTQEKDEVPSEKEENFAAERSNRKGEVDYINDDEEIKGNGSEEAVAELKDQIVVEEVQKDTLSKDEERETQRIDKEKAVTENSVEILAAEENKSNHKVEIEAEDPEAGDIHKGEPVYSNGDEEIKGSDSKKGARELKEDQIVTEEAHTDRFSKVEEQETRAVDKEKLVIEYLAESPVAEGNKFDNEATNPEAHNVHKGEAFYKNNDEQIKDNDGREGAPEQKEDQIVAEEAHKDTCSKDEEKEMQIIKKEKVATEYLAELSVAEENRSDHGVKAEETNPKVDEFQKEEADQINDDGVQKIDPEEVAPKPQEDQIAAKELLMQVHNDKSNKDEKEKQIIDKEEVPTEYMVESSVENKPDNEVKTEATNPEAADAHKGETVYSTGDDEIKVNGSERVAELKEAKNDAFRKDKETEIKIIDKMEVATEYFIRSSVPEGKNSDHEVNKTEVLESEADNVQKEEANHLNNDEEIECSNPEKVAREQKEDQIVAEEVYKDTFGKDEEEEAHIKVKEKVLPECWVESSVAEKDKSDDEVKTEGKDSEAGDALKGKADYIYTDEEIKGNDPDVATGPKEDHSVPEKVYKDTFSKDEVKETQTIDQEEVVTEYFVEFSVAEGNKSNHEVKREVTNPGACDIHKSAESRDILEDKKTDNNFQESVSKNIIAEDKIMTQILGQEKMQKTEEEFGAKHEFATISAEEMKKEDYCKENQKGEPERETKDLDIQSTTENDEATLSAREREKEMVKHEGNSDAAGTKRLREGLPLKESQELAENSRAMPDISQEKNEKTLDTKESMEITPVEGSLKQEVWDVMEPEKETKYLGIEGTIQNDEASHSAQEGEKAMIKHEGNADATGNDNLEEGLPTREYPELTENFSAAPEISEQSKEKMLDTTESKEISSVEANLKQKERDVTEPGKETKDLEIEETTQIDEATHSAQEGAWVTIKHEGSADVTGTNRLAEGCPPREYLELAQNYSAVPEITEKSEEKMLETTESTEGRPVEGSLKQHEGDAMEPENETKDLDTEEKPQINEATHSAQEGAGVTIKHEGSADVTGTNGLAEGCPPREYLELAQNSSAVPEITEESEEKMLDTTESTEGRPVEANLKQKEWHAMEPEKETKDLDIEEKTKIDEATHSAQEGAGVTIKHEGSADVTGTNGLAEGCPPREYLELAESSIAVPEITEENEEKMLDTTESTEGRPVEENLKQKEWDVMEPEKKTKDLDIEGSTQNDNNEATHSAWEFEMEMVKHEADAAGNDSLAEELPPREYEELATNSRTVPETSKKSKEKMLDAMESIEISSVARSLKQEEWDVTEAEKEIDKATNAAMEGEVETTKHEGNADATGTNRLAEELPPREDLALSGNSSAAPEISEKSKEKFLDTTGSREIRPVEGILKQEEWDVIDPENERKVLDIEGITQNDDSTHSAQEGDKETIKPEGNADARGNDRSAEGFPSRYQELAENFSEVPEISERSNEKMLHTTESGQRRSIEGSLQQEEYDVTEPEEETKNVDREGNTQNNEATNSSQEGEMELLEHEGNADVAGNTASTFRLAEGLPPREYTEFAESSSEVSEISEKSKDSMESKVVAATGEIKEVKLQENMQLHNNTATPENMDLAATERYGREENDRVGIFKHQEVSSLEQNKEMKVLAEDESGEDDARRIPVPHAQNDICNTLLRNEDHITSAGALLRDTLQQNSQDLTIFPLNEHNLTAEASKTIDETLGKFKGSSITTEAVLAAEPAEDIDIQKPEVGDEEFTRDNCRNSSENLSTDKQGQELKAEDQVYQTEDSENNQTSSTTEKDSDIVQSHEEYLSVFELIAEECSNQSKPENRMARDQEGSRSIENGSTDSIKEAIEGQVSLYWQSGKEQELNLEAKEQTHEGQYNDDKEMKALSSEDATKDTGRLNLEKQEDNAEKASTPPAGTSDHEQINSMQRTEQTHLITETVSTEEVNTKAGRSSEDEEKEQKVEGQVQFSTRTSEMKLYEKDILARNGEYEDRTFHSKDEDYNDQQLKQEPRIEELQVEKEELLNANAFFIVPEARGLKHAAEDKGPSDECRETNKMSISMISHLTPKSEVNDVPREEILPKAEARANQDQFNDTYTDTMSDLEMQGKPATDIELKLSTADENLQLLQQVPVDKTFQPEIEILEPTEAPKAVEGAQEAEYLESMKVTDDYLNKAGKSGSTTLAECSHCDLQQPVKEPLQQQDVREAQDQHQKLPALYDINSSAMVIDTKDGPFCATSAKDSSILPQTEKLEAVSFSGSEKCKPEEADTNKSSPDSINILQLQLKADEENFQAVGENQEPPKVKPEVRPHETEKATSEEATLGPMPRETSATSLSDLIWASKKEISSLANDFTAEIEPHIQKEEMKDVKTEIAEYEEAKTDEEGEGDEHKRTVSAYDSPVTVEIPSDIDTRAAHKKSHHNILSGVGSKVKHSIAKVKKAITGKSSHPKPPTEIK